MKMSLERASICSLLAISALIRYFFIFKWHPLESYLFSDAASYYHHGQDILAKHWSPYLFFQPVGMPLVIAASLYLTGGLNLVAWIHFITSVLCVYLIWYTAKNLTNNQLALLCLAIATFHYPFIFMSGILLSESLFTFFIALLFALLSRQKQPLRCSESILAGIIFSISLLFKGNLSIFLPLILFWNFWVYKKAKPIIVWLLTVLIIAGFHGMVAKDLIGKYQLGASNGGFNFMVGKCEWKKNGDSNGYWWMPPLFFHLEENNERYWNEPFTNSAFFLSEGLSCIKKNPTVMIDSLRYIPYLFIDNDLWPSLNTKPEYKKLARNYVLFFDFIALPGIIIGLLLCIKNYRSQQFALFVLPTLSLFILSWLFFSEIRFRIPFDVIFIPLSLYGWDFILNSTLNMTSKTRFIVLSTGIFIASISTSYALVINSSTPLSPIMRIHSFQLSTIVNGGPWDAPGNIVFSKSLDIYLQHKMRIKKIDVSVDNNDTYRVEAFSGRQLVPIIDIMPSQHPGMTRHVYTLDHPTPETDEIQITAILGDGKYSIGHFIAQ